MTKFEVVEEAAAIGTGLNGCATGLGVGLANAFTGCFTSSVKEFCD